MPSCVHDECVSSCPKGWEENGSHCYYWSTRNNSMRVTWVEAEDACVQLGGHLASITSNATNEYVLKKIVSRFNRFWIYWIGGINIGRGHNVWKWTDCSDWEFTDWGENPPSGSLGNLPENDQLCLTIHKLKGTWRAARCEYERNVLCSRKLCSGKTNLFHLFLIFKETTTPTATTATPTDTTTTAQSELGMN